jgi:1-deoxy-D-xylulose-5-phosphate synthase
LRELLREAIGVDDAPTVVRFPRGSTPTDIAALDRAGGCDVLARAGSFDVLLVSIGAMAALCADVAERLSAQGIGVTLVDPRWVKPVDPALVDLAGRHRLVVSVEDGVRTGGCGMLLAQTLHDADVHTPARIFALPDRFLAHASRAAILAEAGLTAQDVARQIVETVAVAGGETIADRRAADV